MECIQKRLPILLKWTSHSSLILQWTLLFLSIFR